MSKRNNSYGGRKEARAGSTRAATMDIAETMQAMGAAVLKENATAGVPSDGRGIIIHAPKGSPGDVAHSYTDEGWLKTDGLVLVFEDIVAGTGGAEPDRVRISRPDLCPNMRKVRLTDYV
jgi:hypothetical protein